MSERIRDAKKAVDSEMTELADVALELEQDIKTKISSGQEAATKSIAAQGEQIRALCALGKAANYAGVKFEGITLENKDAFNAKLRLLVGALKSNLSTQAFFAKKLNAYKENRTKITKLANQLDVLKQTLAGLLDAKKVPDSGIATSALQQAITGVDGGAKLRANYEVVTLDQLYAEAAEQNKSLEIEDAEIDKIKNEGGVDGNTDAKPPVQKGFLERIFGK